MRERGEDQLQPGMGDSTSAMTIEFLRARLLSERSVSRTARQRADQLAKRVMEIDEQLRIVTIQRKKAQKAAAEVLAILESEGMGDSSEVIDSSSDQDEVSVGGMRESGIASNEMDDRTSGSELDVSPNQGKSLSWKGHSNDSYNSGKEKLKHIRQRQSQNNLFSKVVSSPKYHLGRSCRKIKRGKLAADAEVHWTTAFHLQESERGTNSGYSDDQTNNQRDILASNSVLCLTSIQGKETNGSLNDNRSNRDEEMRRILEDQAELINEYQDEENAQREWEEKYNEKCANLGLSGHEDESAITKLAIDDRSEEGLASSKEATAISDALNPTDVSTISSLNNKVPITDAVAQEFGMSDRDVKSDSHEPFTVRETSARPTEGDYKQKLFYGSSDTSSHSNSSLHQPIYSPSSNFNGINPTGRSSEIQNQPSPQLPEVPSNTVGSVLKALQHAKMSVHQELSRHPSNHETLAITPSVDPELRGSDYDKMLGITINSSGLFRLPSEHPTEISLPGPKFDSPGLRLGSTYSGIDNNNSSNYWYPNARYVETAPRISITNRYFDPYVTPEIGMPGSSTYSSLLSSNVRNRSYTTDGLGSPYAEDIRGQTSYGQKYLYGSHTWPEMRYP